MDQGKGAGCTTCARVLQPDGSLLLGTHAAGLTGILTVSMARSSTKDRASTFALLRMRSPAISEELEGGACVRRCPSRHVASRCPGASSASRLAGRQPPVSRWLLCRLVLRPYAAWKWLGKSCTSSRSPTRCLNTLQARGKPSSAQQHSSSKAVHQLVRATADLCRA